MKSITTIILLTYSLVTFAQTRYFEFTFRPANTSDWRDSSFIAATSDQNVIDSVLADIQKPLIERKHIHGPIEAGNEGYNHNATHWFLWHFIPYGWNLVENSVEVCDGRPFSDVDSDTSYWFNTVIYFCPWGIRVSRKVFISGVDGNQLSASAINIYPDPATNYLTIEMQRNAQIEIINIEGQIIKSIASDCKTSVDVSTFARGMYFVKAKTEDGVMVKKFVKE
jgi:hypothetical protein